MPITPQPSGSVSPPNTLAPEAEGAVSVPNTLAAEAAGTPSAPNTLTAETVGAVAIPNTLTAETEGAPAIPNTLTPEAAGAVAIPNTLNAEAAGTPAVPNTLTSSDAATLPRTLCPTVSMNFAAGLYAQNGAAVTESSLLTYARGSSATFIDRQLGATGRWEYFLNTEATGNVKRTEYDAATGENLGVLIEQASTNLLLRSEEFDNAAWTKSNAAVTADAVIAPDLTVTADKFEAGSTAVIGPELSQALTVTATQKYTFSAFVKRSEASYIQMTWSGGQVANNPRVNFDLTLGVLGSQDVDVEHASITPVGNDWFRISATVTAVGVALTNFLHMAQSATDARASTNSWTAGQGLYVWGAQAEQSEVPTSYIATIGATVSRLADQLSIPVLGNVPSGDVSYIGDVRLTGDSLGAARFLYVAADTGAGGLYTFVNSSGDLQTLNGGTFREIAATGTYPNSFKFATIFDSSVNTLTGFLNGVQTITGDAGAPSFADVAGVVGVGSSNLFTGHINGHIKHLTIYDAALTANEVSQL